MELWWSSMNLSCSYENTPLFLLRAGVLKCLDKKGTWTSTNTQTDKVIDANVTLGIWFLQNGSLFHRYDKGAAEPLSKKRPYSKTALHVIPCPFVGETSGGLTLDPFVTLNGEPTTLVLTDWTKALEKTGKERRCSEKSKKTDPYSGNWKANIGQLQK